MLSPKSPASSQLPVLSRNLVQDPHSQGCASRVGTQCLLKVCTRGTPLASHEYLSPRPVFSARTHSPPSHLAPPSLEISRRYLLWRCLPKGQRSASFWLLSFLLGKRNGTGREKARGKHDVEGALDRLSLSGWLKCKRQLGKAGMEPGRRGWDREIFSPTWQELLSHPLLFSLLPFPCSHQVHVT